MFTNVSSVGTKLDKISVQRKIIFTCSAAAILFFIKNPIVMFSIFAALLLLRHVASVEVTYGLHVGSNDVTLRLYVGYMGVTYTAHGS